MPKSPAARAFSLAIEYFREDDGRWLADIPALPGVTAYGRTKKAGHGSAFGLWRCSCSPDRGTRGTVPDPMNVSFIAA